MGSIIKNAALAATAFLAVSANCHMIMRSPVPYGKSTLNNSPLDPSGSDFPCKQRPGVYDAEGAQNIMAIGEPQTLSFTGSAVHGGGSCQVALTTDLAPTKNSKWMVIKSIEGGCPSNAPGNLPEDPNGSGASTFQFTVPEGIAPGEYTLSWSWLNKIGNREYYQNCAPATVTGAKKKRYIPTPKVSKRQTSFPDLFVCNLASINSCVAPENFDFEYPNPGQDVQKFGTGPYTLLGGGGGGNTTPDKPTGIPASSGAAVPTAGATGAPGGGNPTYNSPASTGAVGQPTFAGGPPGGATGASSATLAVVPVSLPAATGGNGAPGVFATGVSSNTVPAATQTGTANTGSGSTGSTGSTGGNTTDRGTTGVVGVQSGPCSNEGAWACSNDGTSFQRCASGSWSTTLSMPSGLKCTPGTADNIDIVPARVKRHMHGHLRRITQLLGDSIH